MKKSISHYSLIKFLVILSTATMLLSSQAMCKLNPLVLIPGNGGNQLEARLEEEYYKPSSLWCSSWLYPLRKQSGGWFRLWFDPTVLLAPLTKCFNERMMLCYDDELDDYRNAPGVQTRILDFGSTKSLLCLDPRLRKATSYMEPLVKALEQAGYITDQTLFGAPYDFRYGLAAAGHRSQVASQFLQDLKQLIETTSKQNQGKPVILLSHSLGGLFIHHFLSRNTLSWRRKYIKHFIALSAPWGGTIEQMKTFASGNTLGVPLVNPLLVRPQQRSSESNQWLLPSTKVFGDKTKPLVVTPQVNYTAYDMDRFFEDIGFLEGIGPYNSRVLPLMEEMVFTGVPVTCVYGRGVDTPEVLVYRNGFDEEPEIKYGDGDGTVNLQSLKALELILGMKENEKLKKVEINGVSHTSILKDEIALKEIVKQISTINEMSDQQDIITNRKQNKI